MKKITFLFVILFSSGFLSDVIAQYNIVWKDLVNVSVTGNGISKSGNLNQWDSGAASENIISGDGWVEGVTQNNNKRKVLGLSESNTDELASTIDYGILIYHHATVYIYNGGSVVAGPLRNYNAGDLFRIEKIGTTINYLHNGIQFYSVNMPYDTDLICDISFFNQGGGFSSIQMSSPVKYFFVNDDSSSDPDIRYSIGKVTIGPNDIDKSSNDYNLFVTEGILTEKVTIAGKNSVRWADFVFEEDYQLTPIEEIERSIKENKHLPNVPSAKEIAEQGINIAEMDAILLRQIEELWLQMINMKEEVETLKKENRILKANNGYLKNNMLQEIQHPQEKINPKP